jgi:hypothetical protein
MGLIRKLSGSRTKTKIFDLSRLFDNQNLLEHNLDDLLRRDGPGQTVPALSESVLSSFMRYGTIPDAEFLDFRELSEIFKQQSDLVDLALLIGNSEHQQTLLGANEQVRSDENLRAWRVLYDQILSADTNRARDYNLYQRASAISRANSRLSVDDLNKLIENVLKNVKEGDIIDISGYRGTGYYYVLQNSKQGFKAIKTKGEFGCHLPQEAWTMIQLHGVEFFEAADVWACVLPKSTFVTSSKISFTCSEGYEFLFSWLASKETMTIDGQSYKGEIIPQ